MRIRIPVATLLLTFALGLFTSAAPAMANGDFDGDGTVDLGDGAQLLRCLAGPIDVAGSGDPYGSGLTQTTPVGYYDGSQTPSGVEMVNGFGLYDMAGNVSQWCNDRYSPSYYEVSPFDNPLGPVSGGSRLLRGGSWFFTTIGLRCAFRDWSQPAERFRDVGFRVVAPK